MTVVLTIRDVPRDVRDALAQEARERSQSLQAYLLAVLHQQAAFSRNRRLLVEVEDDLFRHGGAGPDAPDAADILARERARTADGEVDDGTAPGPAR